MLENGLPKKKLKKIAGSIQDKYLNLHVGSQQHVYRNATQDMMQNARSNLA